MSAACTTVRVPLDVSLSPTQAALLVRGDAHPFVLIGKWAGGGALIGSEPVRVAAHGEDPFATLDEQPEVDPFATLDEQAEAHAPGADAVVGGGWFGYLGFQLGRLIESLHPSPSAPSRLPEFGLRFYDHLLRLDADGQWWFEALRTEARAPTLEARLAELRRRAAAPPDALPFATDPWRAAPSGAGHELAVEACRERIHAGDLFQANICVRLESRLRGDPLDLFANAVSELRPDRAAFLSGPWGAIASLSPELFLERRGRRVRSAPIKGTRPRPDDPRAARHEREALDASAKDRAENVMIVDLVRNDLGRVCEPGSIGVDALAQVRPHTGVWHLVSEVSGRLREGVGDGALVRAAFPPGSVTGAPKVAALNVIAELESTARSVYTGAIGFASPLAGLELSVAIRTFEFAGDRAWLGVGGGIVADSDANAEAAECVTKARPLLDAIGASLAPFAGVERATTNTQPPRPARLAPRPVPRPDPSFGVFDTLLIADGSPVWLDHHLDRLERSIQALYGASLPSTLADELTSAAAEHAGRGRLRVNATPTHTGVSIDFELTPAFERRLPVGLAPATIPGGIGPHKWMDRRLLDAYVQAAAGREPLLCDLDGFVLETARANVFAVLDSGEIVTPPADGRILPGVTRAQVLELATALNLSAVVRPIHLAEIHAAQELFVTGSLGGVEPAQLDGSPEAPGALTTRLASLLHRAELAAARW